MTQGTGRCCTLCQQSSLSVARSPGPSRCLVKPELRADKAAHPERYYGSGHRPAARVLSGIPADTLAVLPESVFL